MSSEKLTKDKVSELEAEHGKLLVNWEFNIAFKVPEPGPYQRYQDSLAKFLAREKGSMTQARRALALDSVVFPEKDAAKKIIAIPRFFGSLGKLCDHLSELAGSELEFELSGND